MPAGLLSTTPVPAPDLLTVSVELPSCTGSKVAVTVWLESTEKVQAPLPPQGKPQAEKIDPAFAVAVKSMVVPTGKLALQVVPQLIPLGLLVIVPEPEPFFWIVNVTGLTVLCVRGSRGGRVNVNCAAETWDTAKTMAAHTKARRTAGNHLRRMP
jgi:hypothetical protein